MDNLNNYLSDLMTNHYYEYDSESENEYNNIQSGGDIPLGGGIPLIRQCKPQKRSTRNDNTETTDKENTEEHHHEKKNVNKVENSINIKDIIRIKRNIKK